MKNTIIFNMLLCFFIEKNKKIKRNKSKNTQKNNEKLCKIDSGQND